MKFRDVAIPRFDP